MKSMFRSTDVVANAPQNQMYRAHTSASSSSTFTYFTEQAIRAGFPSGNFARPEMYGGPWDGREAIQREIEKERIREEIIAEEIARKRVLEAEVRRELMMEREMMAMRNCGGFSSPFMHPPQMNQNNLFERRMQHPQPIGLEERIIRSLEEKYMGGGRRQENGGFEMVQFQRLPDSPKIKEITTPVREDLKQKVIILGKPDGSGPKRKLTSPVAPVSSDRRSDGSQKKPKEEWSCAICQVSATSQRGLNEHLEGKKHQSKEAALRAQRAGPNFGLGVAPAAKPVKAPPNPLRKKLVIEPKPVKPPPPRSGSKKGGAQHKREKFKFWCEMCQVGAFVEKVMNHHRKGKRHLTNLLELSQNGILAEVKHVTLDGEDVKTVEDDVSEAGTMIEAKTIKDAVENVDGGGEEDDDTIETGDVSGNKSV